MEQKTQGYLYLIGFAACIPMANWLIENVGVYCDSPGPCMIPVAPGILAPSGVLMVGLALVLRDLVQRMLGFKWALAAIFVGAFLSGLVASPTLVFASIAAFILSETMDLAVYTPLQKKGLVLAVFVSSVVGLVADSVVFLWFAFGSFDFIEGQIIGKALMVLASLPFIHWIRRREVFHQEG
ncbi:MAG: hypothetical protein CFH06_00789 [Alphaproteobacteria bacterium MarineAlpha3_Bin5]|nr:beta-carotene 15,15'-monooxygenase [Magnetovibrio sp.]PPR78462.1 MAG: hypothetical protein CFH06_00789 [Alphaproteobacteria bacterium MarineAlpha3_Bin5]|tara:strand:+ start:107 stop:652 length:546 start_codon:yes stop_codon:yes gene_type:complete